MRLRGHSWWDISVRFGLSPEVYYVPVALVPGPPYGRALGHYKKKQRKQWKTIVLTDADIVNLVELRFLSEHHAVPPERIIALRAATVISWPSMRTCAGPTSGGSRKHGDATRQGQGPRQR